MNIRVDIERSGASWSAGGARQAMDMERIVDHLREMSEIAGADRSIVLRTGVLGGKSAKPTITALHEGAVPTNKLTADDRLVRRIVSHMNTSMLPLIALGDKELAAPVLCCTKRIEWLDFGRDLGSERVLVLPVKLGGGSEGAIILSGDGLELDVAKVLVLHRRAYGVFKALLALELEKSAPRQNLNDRELECLQLAGEGLKSELIGQRLQLSVHTVNAYLSTATAKLDSVNRIQAIAKAIRLGYLA